MTMTPSRVKCRGYVGTLTGRKVFTDGQGGHQFSYADIAHGLSNMSRYNGQTAVPISVAEHSVYVHDLLQARSSPCSETPREWWQAVCLGGLLHDATEAYMADLVRPWKNTFPDYKKQELALADQIFAWVGLELSEEQRAYIKLADDAALYMESWAAYGRKEADSWQWERKHEIDNFLAAHRQKIRFWQYPAARAEFLQRLGLYRRADAIRAVAEISAVEQEFFLRQVEEVYVR